MKKTAIILLIIITVLIAATGCKMLGQAVSYIKINPPISDATGTNIADFPMQFIGSGAPDEITYSLKIYTPPGYMDIVNDILDLLEDTACDFVNEQGDDCVGAQGNLISGAAVGGQSLGSINIPTQNITTTSLTCIDTDGGINLTVSGISSMRDSAGNGIGPIGDACANQTTIIETYCLNNTQSSITQACPTGTTCQVMMLTYFPSASSPTSFTQIASAYCTGPQPYCGDGNVDFFEQCDDNNTITTDSCINCMNATCGDGYVWTGVEQCDPPNNLTCSANCTNITQPGIQNITQQINFTVTKTSPNTAYANNTLNYTITITNTGTTALTGTLDEIYPGQVQYLSDTLTMTKMSTSSWMFAIPINVSSTGKITVMINANTTNNTNITNTINVTVGNITKTATAITTIYQPGATIGLPLPGCSPNCTINESCSYDSDCITGLKCTNGTCQIPPAQTSAANCSDGTLNQNETDIDCGGICPPCGVNSNCLTTNDCQANLTCTNGKCRVPAVGPIDVEYIPPEVKLPTSGATPDHSFIAIGTCGENPIINTILGTECINLLPGEAIIKLGQNLQGNAYIILAGGTQADVAKAVDILYNLGKWDAIGSRLEIFHSNIMTSVGRMDNTVMKYNTEYTLPAGISFIGMPFTLPNKQLSSISLPSNVEGIFEYIPSLARNVKFNTYWNGKTAVSELTTFGDELNAYYVKMKTAGSFMLKHATKTTKTRSVLAGWVAYTPYKKQISLQNIFPVGTFPGIISELWCFENNQFVQKTIAQSPTIYPGQGCWMRLNQGTTLK